MSKAADWDGREFRDGECIDFNALSSGEDDKGIGEETHEEELPPVHVGGGSDSRASWAYPGDPDYPGEQNSRRKNTGCLVALIGGLSTLGGAGFGLYETIRYLL
jgi:hypothetical protein